MDVQQAKRHVPQLVKTHHLREFVHGATLVGRFNAATANVVTNLLGSMNFFWFCVILDLVELPAVIGAGSVIAWISYVSQTVIQLLALPALGAGQRMQQAASDARAEADHATLSATHALAAHIAEHVEKIVKPNFPVPFTVGTEGRVTFTPQSVQGYLDQCITVWRKRHNEGDEHAPFYLDAFQSVRDSLFGEMKG